MHFISLDDDIKVKGLEDGLLFSFFPDGYKGKAGEKKKKVFPLQLSGNESN